MKTNLRSLLLIGFLMVGMFAFSPPQTPAMSKHPGITAKERIVQIDKSVQVADVRSDMLISAHAVWVKESVGKMLMNSKRVIFASVKELEGFRTVIEKPKITEFNGIGYDHFPRADV